jgi:hypothetical protein
MTPMCTRLFSIFLRVSSPFPSRRHQFYRCECHHPNESLASRPMLTTHRSGIFGYSIVTRQRRSPIGQSNSTSGCPAAVRLQTDTPARRNHLPLVRNRVGYFGGTGETSGLGFGSFFLCLVVFLFSIFVFTCSRLSLYLFLAL